MVIDHAKAGRPLQAFMEVRFSGTADLEEIRATASTLPEVLAVFATAGDPDALVWIRVPDVEELGKVIGKLRRSGRVTGYQDPHRGRYLDEAARRRRRAVGLLHLIEPPASAAGGMAARLSRR